MGESTQQSAEFSGVLSIFSDIRFIRILKEYSLILLNNTKRVDNTPLIDASLNCDGLFHKMGTDLLYKHVTLYLSSFFFFLENPYLSIHF